MELKQEALMKTLLASVSSLVLAGVLLSPAASAPSAKRFSPHQEPRGIGNLVVPGDRVALVYDAGVKGATGSVFVRSDKQRDFRRLTLSPERGPSSTYRTRVPANLLRGHELLYYAVLRAPTGRRTARVPSKGTSSAWILQQSRLVNLGVHRFGETREPEAVVASASADQVGWQIHPPECGCGPSFGPQSFAVGRDRSIWLHDSLNDRMLVWNPDAPDTIVRSVPLPERTADNDVALGPAGTIYVTSGVGSGLNYRIVLNRLSPTGQLLWQSRLAGDFFGHGSFLIGVNSSLRYRPDGTLNVLASMNGLPGGEQAWMPVATRQGQPLSRAQQLRRAQWPSQPVGNGLRLVSELYTRVVDGAPHEARFALIDRSDHVIRSWRIASRTAISFDVATPEVVGRDVVAVVDAARPGEIDHIVFRLSPSGAESHFSLPVVVFGDNILADVRVGPDGKLYELGSSPETGIVISRYSL
ncbi:MAG: hypothetical protein ABI896_03100 [Actinomycetota bacterium]